MQRVRLVLELAVPTSLCSVINISVEILNLRFISKFSPDNEKILDGVGMGNMTQNLLALSIILGFNSTIDTLVSQAAGAGNKQLCGLYLNRGRFIMTMLFIPIIFIICNTGNILKAVGQDEEVAEYAQRYVMAFLPGLYI
jgi:Na+-driven multidrug efflux pump